MMVWIGGLLVVFGFLALGHLFRLVEKGNKVIAIAQSALETVRDSDSNDKQKETAMQKYAKQLFLLFFSIVTLSFIAIIIPFGLLWLMDFAGLLKVNQVTETTMSWEFITATVAISSIIFGVSKVKNSE